MISKPSRAFDDRPQEGHMGGERRSPLRTGFDRGARPSTDKGLGHFDIACARQMIEMRAEVAVGRAGRPEPGEVDRAAISCRKSEIKLSLPHEQSIPSACRILGPPFRRRFRDEKSARKNLLLKISCNPLISLDSDERIQGNPRKSNLIIGGFRNETATSQENPNRVN
jgi:hypothetical protein